MNPIHINALISLAKSEPFKVRPEIELGIHPVRFVLNVTGEIKKGEAEFRPKHFSVKWERLAMLGLSHLNSVTVSHVLDLYFAEQGQVDDEVKNAVQDRVNAIVKLPEWHSGKVTGKLSCAVE
jgi:hypothetical protein